MWWAGPGTQRGGPRGPEASPDVVGVAERSVLALSRVSGACFAGG